MVDLPKYTDLSADKLSYILKQRGSGIIGKFGKEVLYGVEDLKMLTILRAIKDNRKDWLRPALTSFSCEAVGGNADVAETAGVMFSLLSTGISLHDDIVDKSPRKHLRVTVLGKYGVNKSLLVGDLLIVKGWAKISDMLKDKQAPGMVAEIAKIYGDACTEMCEAEFIENSYRKQLETSVEEHERMLWKAMAEMEACTRIGAIIGGGSEEKVKALAMFGRRIGYASRLVDEVKDSLNIEGNLIHRLKFESVPLPLLFAAKSDEQRRLRIQSILKKPESTPSTIRELLGICFESDALGYLLESAYENSDAAANCLDVIEQNFAKDVLLALNRKIFSEMTRTLDRAGFESN